MVETIVLIAIPAIAIVVTGVVIMRNEFKTQKLQEAMFEEYKRCQLYGGDENEKLRELAKGMYGLLETYDKIMGNHNACETPRPLIFDDCKSFKDVARELGIEVEDA